MSWVVKAFWGNSAGTAASKRAFTPQLPWNVVLMADDVVYEIVE
jgi:hypothetical protein